MKKLLCVMMFGMVFGQALIETRGYELNFDEESENDFMVEYDDFDIFFDAFNLTGDIYSIEIIGVKGKCDNAYLTVICEEFGETSSYWNFYHIAGADSLNYGSATQYHDFGADWGIIHINKNGCDNDNISISGECEDNNYSIKLLITGQFENSDVGLQGDLNDDNGVNILDIIFLVNIILDDGTGDINGLIDAVTG